MLGLLGVNPAPQPLDLGASVTGQHAASGLYLLAAVALPLMLLILIAVRVLGAPTRWAAWTQPGSVGWAWRLPYEAFILTVPIAGTVAGERLAVAALASGVNRSAGADRLLLIAAVGLVAMGISGAKFVSRGHSISPAAPST